MSTTHVQMSRVALLVSMVAKTMPIGAAAKRCGIPDRVAVEALKACGNGVVPQQAIAALRHMLAQQEVAA